MILVHGIPISAGEFFRCITLNVGQNSMYLDIHIISKQTSRNHGDAPPLQTAQPWHPILLIQMDQSWLMM